MNNRLPLHYNGRTSFNGHITTDMALNMFPSFANKTDTIESKPLVAPQNHFKNHNGSQKVEQHSLFSVFQLSHSVYPPIRLPQFTCRSSALS